MMQHESENETGLWRPCRQTQRAIASDGAPTPTTIKRRMATLVVNAKETLVTSKSIILPHTRGDTPSRASVGPSEAASLVSCHKGGSIEMDGISSGFSIQPGRADSNRPGRPKKQYCKYEMLLAPCVHNAAGALSGSYPGREMCAFLLSARWRWMTRLGIARAALSERQYRHH